MQPEMQDFGTPDYFEPQSIGAPGNRRFRVITGYQGRTAALWLERDQLQAFSVSLQQLVAQVSGEDVLRPALDTPPPPPTPREDFPDAPDMEFQVGPIALGYDEEEEQIVILIAPIEIVEIDGIPTLNEQVEPQFRASLSQTEADQFIRSAESILAAGRPRCPYCGQALNRPNEPHGCIKQNGHRQLELN